MKWKTNFECDAYLLIYYLQRKLKKKIVMPQGRRLFRFVCNSITGTNAPITNLIPLCSDRFYFIFERISYVVMFFSFQIQTPNDKKKILLLTFNTQILSVCTVSVLAHVKRGIFFFIDSYELP